MAGARSCSIQAEIAKQVDQIALPRVRAHIRLEQPMRKMLALAAVLPLIALASCAYQDGYGPNYYGTYAAGSAYYGYPDYYGFYGNGFYDGYYGYGFYPNSFYGFYGRGYYGGFRGGYFGRGGFSRGGFGHAYRGGSGLGAYGGFNGGRGF